MAIRVVLVDDHHLVRQGLRALLAKDEDLDVVGETGDGLEVAGLVEALRPDVLLLDLMLPGLSGLDVIEQVIRRSPGTRVLVVSMHANEGYVLKALRNGASGYMLKDADAGELGRGIRAVAAGRQFLGAPLSDRAITAYARRVDAETSFDPYEALTSREREVIQLAAEGRSNGEIGRRLTISPRTVEIHRAHGMRKLGLATLSELIRYALKRGLIPLDEP
jgi:DNA-binding NarL/FixJ family response regulator